MSMMRGSRLYGPGPLFSISPRKKKKKKREAHDFGRARSFIEITRLGAGAAGAFTLVSLESSGPAGGFYFDGCVRDWRMWRHVGPCCC